jgi:hypothetical protein
MALRIRTYVPHRHKFPVIAESISASVGLLIIVNRAAAVMSWPAWQ